LSCSKKATTQVYFLVICGVLFLVIAILYLSTGGSITKKAKETGQALMNCSGGVKGISGVCMSRDAKCNNTKVAGFGCSGDAPFCCPNT
jgi:hypothetical protein